MLCGGCAGLRGVDWRVMKHGILCAIGHNLADSMASGLAFLIGYRELHVFDEVAASPDGAIEVDFLSGKILRGSASDNLALAARQYAEILPSFSLANGAEASDFTSLSAVFERKNLKHHVTVSFTDKSGRSSTTDYAGLPLKRLIELDALGRIRKVPRQTD